MSTSARNVAVPWGTMHAKAADGHLTSLRFGYGREAGPADDVLDELQRQLDAYFAGERTMLALPLRFEGSAFQQRVWAELRKIECGQTITYGELARRIGQPGASRAVGLANAKNPIPLVIPCHRVVAASAKLGGYSGGGPEVKRFLLDHEAAMAGQRLDFAMARRESV